MARRTVFILGAGASREAGAPLMGDFLDVADVVRERQQGSQAREYFDLVFRTIAELDPVFAKSTIEVGNIENQKVGSSISEDARSFPAVSW